MQILDFPPLADEHLAAGPRPLLRAVSLSTSRWTTVLVGCLGVWVLMRVCFFVGLFGSDDLYLLRYSVLWDRAPANGWEARLLGNGLTWLAIRAFGFSEPAAVAPSLAASLAVLVVTIRFCEHHLGQGAAWWAGLVVAVLPLDVEMATTVSPHTIMTAWMAAGTALFVGRPDSRVARYACAGCLGLGVVAHLAGIYYVASLAAAAIFVDGARYGRAVLAALLGCGACLTLDMVAFELLYGNAFLRFELSAGAVANPLNTPPSHADGSVNSAFFLWPIRNLVFSKAFGVTMLLAMCGSWWRWQQLQTPLRVLLLATAVLWLWMSFGSATPWDYRPFARNLRYLQPATLAVAALFAALLAGQCARRARTAAGAGVLTLCVLNLLGSGSWDQRTHVSSELLNYARQTPDISYLTDYKTLNEMYVLNKLEPIPNVATTANVRPPKLLDRNARRVRRSGLSTVDAILVNDLNADQTPEYNTIVEMRRGQTIYESEASYRMICRLLPPLQRFPWATKKPPARVVQLGPP